MFPLVEYGPASSEGVLVPVSQTLYQRGPTRSRTHQRLCERKSI